MDRERLQQVQQSDLTESRLNQDFVYWLKNSGPTYLLVMMLALCAYLGWERWKTHRADTHDAAWADFAGVEFGTAISAEEIASSDKIEGVDSIANLARLNAARGYLLAVTVDKDLNPADAANAKLSPEKRADYLARADKLAAEVVAADDKSAARTMQTVGALFCRAAVAEAKNEMDAARGFYDQAAQRAGETYPKLADLARERITSLERLSQATPLPMQSERPAFQMPKPREQPTVDDAIDELLNPPASAATQ